MHNVELAVRRPASAEYWTVYMMLTASAKYWTVHMTLATMSTPVTITPT